MSETPPERLERFIKERSWPGLTRRLDAEVIQLAVGDTKVTGREGAPPTIYVPYAAEKQLSYYQRIAEQRPELGLRVVSLPQNITNDVYRTLLEEPGLLALDTEETVDPGTGATETRAVPFVVPGGRFNEFFGWDSYFIGLGLLESDRTDLVKGILKNWIFEIQHYGLIPNANRSYFALRSQPPFVTDLSIRLYEATKSEPDAKELLRVFLQGAIKEYHQVWMRHPRLDFATGLSKYCPVGGFGVPKEVEPGHFDSVLKPYADRHGLTIAEFTERFDNQELSEPTLEKYLQHDRGVRESGHDTSTRLDGRAANLAIQDLNFCLYKYETDIASAIETIFGGTLEISPETQLARPAEDAQASTWRQRAAARKKAVDTYLWNEEKGSYFDFDVVKKEQITSESATSLWALWCGIASPEQARQLVSRALPRYECRGGLATTSAETVREGQAFEMAHGRQWDHPVGWAPHQMLAWEGLRRYGFKAEAARIAYRWLYTVLKTFIDQDGTVCEKYDVVVEKDPHMVYAEYGNQGAEFGFGWTNASFICGLQYLDEDMLKALAALTPYDSIGKTDEKN